MPHGKSCAVPIDLGATWYPGLDYEGALGLVEGGYEPGDIAMTNDPYSGFLATHSPDIVMWKPVFHDGRIIAFAGGHIHNVDVGGAVPASLSRTLTDVHQEGIRIPPAKLYRAGVLDEGLTRVMLANVRVPDQNWGDLKALIAAVNTGERAHPGPRRAGSASTRWSDGLADLLDYAEAQARAVLRSIPDGEYRFTEYCDEDAAGGNPLRLCLKLTIARRRRRTGLRRHRPADRSRPSTCRPAATRATRCCWSAPTTCSPRCIRASRSTSAPRAPSPAACRTAAC